MDKKKILFVCLGNICRSPSAEAIMKHMLKEKGLEGRFYIDSAGIMGYHEGELPDKRMRMHGKRRGYELDSRSRPITYPDFFEFDLILGMDHQNIESLMRKAPDLNSSRKIRMITDYCIRYKADHVPDPYYGGAEGFEWVLDLLEDACEGLIAELTKE